MKKILMILIVIIIVVGMYGCLSPKSCVYDCSQACASAVNYIDALEGFTCDNCHRFVHESIHDVYLNPPGVEMILCNDCYELYLSGDLIIEKNTEQQETAVET